MLDFPQSCEQFISLIGNLKIASANNKIKKVLAIATALANTPPSVKCTDEEKINLQQEQSSLEEVSNNLDTLISQADTAVQSTAFYTTSAVTVTNILTTPLPTITSQTTANPTQVPPVLNIREEIYEAQYAAEKSEEAVETQKNEEHKKTIKDIDNAETESEVLSSMKAASLPGKQDQPENAQNNQLAVLPSQEGDMSAKDTNQSAGGAVLPFWQFADGSKTDDFTMTEPEERENLPAENTATADSDKTLAALPELNCRKAGMLLLHPGHCDKAYRCMR